MFSNLKRINRAESNCYLSNLLYTAISIKLVPKKREKVEYERERLIGKD